MALIVRKLTKEEAGHILHKASLDVKENPGLRYGQAIWNRMPNTLRCLYVGTPYDFYNKEDDEVAAELFLSNFFVEE